nr:HDIG domain-containing metalloprotein [uncultured Acetatifactor sp.]
MERKLPREEAWELLTKYTKTSALQNHALAVEAVMRHFARLNGEDEEVWGVAGLLHDLDYEMYPQEHCRKSEEIMRQRGIDEVYIRAMNCHGYGLCTDVKPETLMEKTLYAVDELAGLINAACLVRPSKSVLDLEVKSLKKKFKDKAFAAGVNREVILKGCEMLGTDLDTLMREAIAGMRESAELIGLKGTL